MRLTESRMPGGPGVFILRHENYAKGPNKYSLAQRPTLMGTMITERQVTGTGLGHYVYKQETLGDIVGALCWPNNPKARDIPAWSWAWPSIMDNSNSGNASTQNYDPDSIIGIGNGGNQPQPDPNCARCKEIEDEDDDHAGDVYPMTVATITITPDSGGGATPPRGGLAPGFFPGFGIIGGNQAPKDKKIVPIPDFRFRPIKPLIVGIDADQIIPKRTVGITLCLTDEATQKEVFFPFIGGGNSIIAVNATGDRRMGTLVYDLTCESEIDKERSARLQSAFWVVKVPFKNRKITADVLPLCSENMIAINYFYEGCRLGKTNVLGGAIIDMPRSATTPPPEVRSIAFMSANFHGPIISGAWEYDKHKICEDGENGNPLKARWVTPAHFNPDGYWLKVASGAARCKEPDNVVGEIMDGPIDFENQIPEDKVNKIKEYDHPTMGHLEYWTHLPDEQASTGTGAETTEKKGACIYHNFFDRSRLGKWKIRSSCNFTEKSQYPPSGGGSYV